MSDLLERLATEEPSEALIRAARKEIERLQAEIADLRDARDGRSVYEMRLEDQIKDMRAVVDAVRKKCQEIIANATEELGRSDDELGYEQLLFNGQIEATLDILRALDG